MVMLPILKGSLPFSWLSNDDVSTYGKHFDRLVRIWSHNKLILLLNYIDFKMLEDVVKVQKLWNVQSPDFLVCSDGQVPQIGHLEQASFL